MYAPAGIHVPLVTPFTRDGLLDTGSLERLARHCLEQGAAGLVVLATTGEAPLLTSAEQEQVLQLCRKVSDEHGTPLTVGAGSIGTDTSIRQAQERGAFADALLVLIPYYLRPTDEGVLDHFAAIGEQVDVPLVAYNIPYRTGKTLRVESLLALLAYVTAVKHCPGAIDQDTLALLGAGAGAVLGGDDAFLYPMLQLGAAGGITASANVAPATYAAMARLVRSGDGVAARALHAALLPMVEALFAEPSPTVIKAVLAALGLIEDPTVRAPLRAPRPEWVAQALDAHQRLPV